MSVVTAGGGDTYRIERVYIDLDETYGSAQAYTGIAPVEPVHVAQIGPPRHDGPTAPEWWARVPVNKRASAAAHPTTAIGCDDFGIRRHKVAGTPCQSQSRPPQTAGLSTVELAGLSNMKVTEAVGIRLPSSQPI